MTYQEIHTIDPFGVADTFVSGLAEVEDIGSGCLRFVFYAKHRVGDKEEWIVVAKLIAPKDAVPAAIFMAAKSCGMALVAELRGMN